MVMPNADPVHKVSIIPRGRAGGYTLMLPKEERNYATRSELIDQLRTLLGGRVAESLVLEEISTGAQNDLERATDLARKMICEFGMSEVLGPITFGRRQDTQVFLGRDISRDRNYSEEVAYSIDKEVRRLIEDAYEKTESMLKEHLDKLHLIAAALIEKETLEAFELEQLMKEGKITGKPVKEEPSEKMTGLAGEIPSPDAEPGPKVVYNTPEASGGNA
jgi:cell division protease FtsH